MITIRTPEEIEKIARAGKLTADTLSFACQKSIKTQGNQYPGYRQEWRKNTSGTVVVYPVKKAIMVILDPSALL